MGILVGLTQNNEGMTLAYLEKADKILAIIKEEGYVLAKDQSLPDKVYIKFKANPELTMPPPPKKRNK